MSADCAAAFGSHPVSLQVMLLRAEFMYGEASEVLVAEHTILGERRREKVGERGGGPHLM